MICGRGQFERDGGRRERTYADERSKDVGVAVGVGIAVIKLVDLAPSSLDVVVPLEEATTTPDDGISVLDESCVKAVETRTNSSVVVVAGSVRDLTVDVERELAVGVERGDSTAVDGADSTMAKVDRIDVDSLVVLSLAGE